MKTIFLTTAITIVLCTMYQTADANAPIRFIPRDTIIQISEEWLPDPDGAWVGVDNSMYKFDSKKELYWSKNGKKWSLVKTGMWQDINAKWMKIDKDELMWSADGKEWERVADHKWQGHDGNWYMFDKSGILLISKDAGDKV
ncbi:MAG: hypothetical protein H7259_04220 [Cytophagales bacterium]|nr:hypothetical protein [Cytophaga sp.]